MNRSPRRKESKTSVIAGSPPSKGGLWAILGFNALLLACLLCRRLPHALRAEIDNIAVCLGPLLLSVGGGAEAIIRARRTRKKPLVFLLSPSFLLLMGVLCFGIGEIIWDYYELILHHDTPFPSLSDAAFLAAYPFLLFGILRISARSLSRANRARILLDSLMCLTAVVTFSWYFTLGPTVLGGAESLLGKIIGTGYPLFDLVLVGALLMLLARADDPNLRGPLRLLALGLSLIVVVDSVFCYQTLHNTYATGELVDVCWPAGYMLIAWAARLLQSRAANEDALPAPTGDAIAGRAPILWRSLLPYALVPAVGALCAFAHHRHGDEALEPGVYIGAFLLVVLVLLRQVFALWENRQLFACLQTAYADLEALNRQIRHDGEQMENLNGELCAMQAELLSNNFALEAANATLESLATTDGMTGIANHRAFQERLRAEIARAQRAGDPLTLLLLDVDHFKSFNDTFGHPAGDMVLKTVARLLRESVRESDFVARYGGEEFAILLPGVTTATAALVAERIRRAVEAHPFAERPVTLSLGLAVARPGEEAEALIARSDAALYGAKRGGRNQVATAATMPILCEDAVSMASGV